MRVLIIGAHGQVGRHLTRHLAEQTAHDPVAMIRDGGQRSTFDAWGVPCVLGDLEYPIDHAVAGCDAVIFAAGSGGKTGKDKTVLIDHLGAIRAAVSAQTNEVPRFILLSSINARSDSDSRIAHYHRAKAAADRFLLEHGQLLDGEALAWTTVHPGRLNDEDASGRIAAQSGVASEGTTSRANTALTLAACLDERATIGKQVSVVDGEQPVVDALRALG